MSASERMREVVGTERDPRLPDLLRLACGHSVRIGDDYRGPPPTQVFCPHCPADPDGPPKSPGADPGGSTPADSAGGDGRPRTPGELDAELFGSLHEALCALARAGSILDGMGEGEGFKALLAASRAEQRVLVATEATEAAWRILGGTIPDDEAEAPADGGTEGEAGR